MQAKCRQHQENAFYVTFLVLLVNVAGAVFLNEAGEMLLNVAEVLLNVVGEVLRNVA